MEPFENKMIQNIFSPNGDQFDGRFKILLRKEVCDAYR
jgi:hypothetical protein